MVVGPMRDLQDAYKMADKHNYPFHQDIRTYLDNELLWLNRKVERQNVLK